MISLSPSSRRCLLISIAKSEHYCALSLIFDQIHAENIGDEELIELILSESVNFVSKTINFLYF